MEMLTVKAGAPFERTLERGVIIQYLIEILQVVCFGF